MLTSEKDVGMFIPKHLYDQYYPTTSPYIALAQSPGPTVWLNGWFLHFAPLELCVVLSLILAWSVIRSWLLNEICYQNYLDHI